MGPKEQEWYEAAMLEQKQSILELAERLAMSEGEARYYEGREETSEEVRVRILEIVRAAPEAQMTWKQVSKVEELVNILVARIALGARG